MNFRERLEQSREKLADIAETVSNTELEDSYACEYFAIENIHRLPACLDLRLPDGRHKAVPYSHFTEIDFDNSGGIEITTATKKIKISGRDLGKLFDYLVAYRVRYVQASTGSDISENGLFGGEILIQEV